MSRRGQVDVVVVGGGIVGAACALAMAAEGLDVVLVEARAPAPWPSDTPDLRVYALAPDGQALLAGLGAWPVADGHPGVAGAHPYRRMRVRDAGGGGQLAFDADRLGRRELGWIAAHGLLVDGLWRALDRRGIPVRCPARVVALARHADGVELRLDDGSRVLARVAVAADGAGSTLRALAGIAVDVHDYGQTGVVAYVGTTLAHEDTAWQRFLPDGPLAFLPCGGGASSIVWTLPTAAAAGVLALDDVAFGEAVTRASAGRLGVVTPRSARAGFPLRRQLAATCAADRVLLVGDAAHVVHPLAGQGMNIGLRDVLALRATVAGARARGVAWDAAPRLARWSRARLSEATVAAHALHGINRLFSNDAMAPVLLRGPLLGLAGRLPPLAAGLWRRASGL